MKQVVIRSNDDRMVMVWFSKKVGGYVIEEDNQYHVCLDIPEENIRELEGEEIAE